MAARRPRARRDRDISALRLCAGHWRSWHGPAAPAHGLGVPEAGSLCGLGLAWAQELRDPASSHVSFRGRRGRCPLRRPFGYSRRRPARPRAPSAHAQPGADGPALAACAGPDVPQANTYVPRPSQPMSAFAPGGVAAGGGGGRSGGGGGASSAGSVSERMFAAPPSSPTPPPGGGGAPAGALYPGAGGGAAAAGASMLKPPVSAAPGAGGQPVRAILPSYALLLFQDRRCTLPAPPSARALLPQRRPCSAASPGDEAADLVQVWSSPQRGRRPRGHNMGTARLNSTLTLQVAPITAALLQQHELWLQQQSSHAATAAAARHQHFVAQQMAAAAAAAAAAQQHSLPALQPQALQPQALPLHALPPGMSQGFQGQGFQGQGLQGLQGQGLQGQGAQMHQLTAAARQPSVEEQQLAHAASVLQLHDKQLVRAPAPRPCPSPPRRRAARLCPSTQQLHAASGAPHAPACRGACGLPLQTA